MTDLGYLDEIIAPYYVSAFGNDFILMDNNAQSQRLWMLGTILKVYGLVQMKRTTHSPDQKPTFYYHRRQIFGLSVRSLMSCNKAYSMFSPRFSFLQFNQQHEKWMLPMH